MTQPGATRYPQPPPVRNRPFGARPGTERERSAPAAAPPRCTWCRYMVFLRAVNTGIVVAALIRQGIQ